jgi:hypothetical protein
MAEAVAVPQFDCGRRSAIAALAGAGGDGVGAVGWHGT